MKRIAAVGDGDRLRAAHKTAVPHIAAAGFGVVDIVRYDDPVLPLVRAAAAIGNDPAERRPRRAHDGESAVVRILSRNIGHALRQTAAVAVHCSGVGDQIGHQTRRAIPCHGRRTAQRCGAEYAQRKFTTSIHHKRQMDCG